MRLASVNTSLPRPVELPGGSAVTGIAKDPRPGPVMLSTDGLEGDGVGNTKDHGGRDQAVYCYGSMDYDWWASQPGVEPHPGLFGENLTIEGMASAELAIGDRMDVGGEVVLEVSAPRIPCSTLAARVGEGGFAQRFAAARRPGAYCRVVTPGIVEAGDPVTHSAVDGPRVTLLDAQDVYYDLDTPPAAVTRLLRAPVAERLRTVAERRLART